MKLIFDVCYDEEPVNGEYKAFVAAILFEDLASDKIIDRYSIYTAVSAEYESGEFYKKEMPCLQVLWSIIPESVKNQIDMVIVDGLYNLWDGRGGLGHHFHDWLKDMGYTDIEVMGIAKKKFKLESEYITKVVRGKDSQTPLNTNGSIPGKDYGDVVKNMYGEYRIPYMVKEVDRMSRHLN